ncbi:MAG TPA: aminomethyl transferase family protein [Candidatus Melainabacteria bacterium]|jgi:aminomethyltransferase|nr:aminomethyl transferase family protein [Candidatus Melainabacteria bacterium]HIN66302.1 aminomethyl transferase family protein [Candidatus Obscuribacterales bacterium]
MLKTTPLHSRTSALMQANQWRRWAGYCVASSYEMTHDREYYAIRNACVLLDVSPLCKYSIKGADALKFLNRLVTRDVSKISVGGMLYTPWCDSRGKILDDGTIAQLGENEYRLTSAEPNMRWLQDNAVGMQVEIFDVSDKIASMSLQGPRSRELLMTLCNAPLGGVKYYEFVNTKIAGVDVMISRTGYTGDLGFELWVDAAKAEKVWDAVVEAGKAFALQPAGIWALDVARIEAGLIMLDIDYTPANKAMTDGQTSTPIELGLNWAISWKKGNFVGRKALLAEKENGSTIQFVGLEIDHKEFERQHHELGLTVPYPFMAWRAVIPLYVDGSQVGYATSGVWSPTLKKYLAFGHVQPKYAQPGSVVTIDLTVDRYRRPFNAKVTKLPFFNPPRKKDILGEK